MVRAASTEQPASAEAVCGSARPAGARQSRRSIRAAGPGSWSYTSRKTRDSGPASAPSSGPACSRLARSETATLGRAASQPPASTSAAGWPWQASTRLSAERGSTVMRTEPVWPVSSCSADLVSRPPSVQGRTSEMPVSGPWETATTRQSGVSGSSASTWSAPAASSSSSSVRRSARAARRAAVRSSSAAPAGAGRPSAPSRSRAACSTGTGVPAGSLSRARSTPSGYRSATCRTNSSARRVLPEPGRPAMSSTRARGALRPERVSRPARSMSARSSFNSRVRPRKRSSETGCAACSAPSGSTA